MRPIYGGVNPDQENRSDGTSKDYKDDISYLVIR